MAKISLERKKELNEPDEFINVSNQVLNYIQQNKNRFFGVIGAFLVMVFCVAGYLYYSDVNEKKAFTAFAADMKWYESDASGENKSLDELKTRGDSFFKKYSGTVAGNLAMARYAGIYYSEGYYDGAVTLYTNLLKDIRGDDAFKNMVLLSLGQTYEAMDNTKAAVDTYEKIVSSNLDVSKDAALFHLGVLYAKTNNMDGSKKAFMQIASDYSDSVYIDLAKEKSAD